jgi:uncharacterized protein
MLLDLAHFRGDADRVERVDPPSAFELAGEEFRLVAPVRFGADVRKDREKVRLVGRVATTMEVACSRCLDSFAVPMDAAFDLLFLPPSVESASGEHEIDDQDAGVSYYRDDVIDLAEVMREQFLLALPMKPLCREACEGLCPECGANRNTSACGCQATWVDPRMAPLAKLRQP